MNGSSVIGSQQCLSNFEGSLLVFPSLERIPPPLSPASFLDWCWDFWRSFQFLELLLKFGEYLGSSCFLKDHMRTPKPARVPHEVYFVYHIKYVNWKYYTLILISEKSPEVVYNFLNVFFHEQGLKVGCSHANIKYIDLPPHTQPNFKGRILSMCLILFHSISCGLAVLFL